MSVTAVSSTFSTSNFPRMNRQAQAAVRMAEGQGNASQILDGGSRRTESKSDSAQTYSALALNAAATAVPRGKAAALDGTVTISSSASSGISVSYTSTGTAATSGKTTTGRNVDLVA